MHYYWMKKKWFLDSLENYLAFSCPLYINTANIEWDLDFNSLHLLSCVAEYSSKKYTYDLSGAEVLNVLEVDAAQRILYPMTTCYATSGADLAALREIELETIYIPEKEYEAAFEITVAYSIVTNLYYRRDYYRSIVYMATALPIIVDEVINRIEYIVDMPCIAVEEADMPCEYVINNFEVTLSNIPFDDLLLSCEYTVALSCETNVSFLPLQYLESETTWNPGYRYSATFESVAVPRFYIVAQINNRIDFPIYISPVYTQDFVIDVDVATIGVNMDVFLQPIIIVYEETGFEVPYNIIDIDDIDAGLVSLTDIEMGFSYYKIDVESFEPEFISFTESGFYLECPYHFNENISFATSVNMLQLITDNIESAPKNYDISIAGVDLTRTRVFSDLTGMKVSDLAGLTFIQLALVNVS